MLLADLRQETKMSLPAIYDWIGFLAAAVIILGTIYFFYHRLTAPDEPGSHHICQLDGFPDIHVPRGGEDSGSPIITRTGAEELAEMLRAVIRKTWARCNATYVAFVPRTRFPVVLIGMTFNEVDPEHRHVMWPMPRDKAFLRLQVGMAYHLAGEIHNMYRYCLHGPQWVADGRTKDADDLARAIAVQAWITETYA